MPTGEDKAWERLQELDPEDVCTRAQVTFDQSSGFYTLTSFGQEIRISPRRREMLSSTVLGAFLVNDLRDLSVLSALWYLIHAKELPLSGQLVKPGDLPGGQIYSQGTHTLPLDSIAGEFGDDPALFLDKGAKLGGQRFGDAGLSLRVFPFPRVPIVINVWRGDDELAPNSAILFDSTCTFHLPPDVIWASAMMTVQVMLCKTA
jgi:hypothetical protein